MNEKGVSFVNLYLPYDFLKDGLIIVDTPGVGSTHQHNTDEVYAFMKNSDAIIFMLSVDSPINEIEQELLHSAKNHASKFYFSINKIDTVSQSDLEVYIDYSTIHYTALLMIIHKNKYRRCHPPRRFRNRYRGNCQKYHRSGKNSNNRLP